MAIIFTETLLPIYRQLLKLTFRPAVKSTHEFYNDM